KETEVYSRITGYYRPLKNWNAGKTQEFKERKEYDAMTSMNVHTEKSDVVIRDNDCECKSEFKPESEILLFATKTCPKCKMAEMMLDKANISYKIIDAEENVELTKSYHVTEAPTMIIPNGQKIENPSNIKKYIEENK
ncbi:MAG: ribonucleoside triphosphate reductase, partial [Gammaproteobacteria bacterium]|nr:ribonucleoside triphosphate reductase [Gammaproteobacteria bacterium]